MAAAHVTGTPAMPKGLRHGFGVNAFQSLVPPHLVQHWLGHASLRTTSIYADVIGPEERAFAPRMGANFRFVAAAGIGRQQYLGALELAGGSFAFAQHRGESTAFGLPQFDPITYIHPDLPVGGPDESTSESKIRRRRSQPQRSKLYRKTRPLPGFLLHLFAHVPASTRRDRHAAPLSRQPALGPPDDRDARTKWSHLPSTRRRTKHPNPRCSGKLAHPRLAKNQPVIITVPWY